MWATWAGMGGGRDLRAVARGTLQQGRQAGSSSVLDQIQPRVESNGLTSVPIQEKKTSLNEVAAQDCALFDSLLPGRNTLYIYTK